MSSDDQGPKRQREKKKLDDLERDLERLLRILEESLRESNHAVRRRCGEDPDGLNASASLVFSSSPLTFATTCVVPFMTPSKKGEFDIPAAFELLDRRRQESESQTGIGVVFGAETDLKEQPGFRVSRRGACMLVSFAEFLSQLLVHDQAALRITLAKDGEDPPVQFLRRHALVDGGVEVDDAIAHVLSWAKSGEGSLIIVGPRGSGKTTLIDEARRQAARARLDASYVVPVLIDRTTSTPSKREKHAMAARTFVRADKLDKQIHLEKLDYLAKHRILAEAQDDVLIDKMSSSSTDPKKESVSILRLAPVAPEDIRSGFRRGLEAHARTWFDAALDRSEDLRDLACRLASFSPMLEAAMEASSSFDSTPAASIDSEAAIDRYTRVLVYDYVDRAIRHHLYEKIFAWQGDGTIATLEDAALTSFTTSDGKPIDGNGFHLTTFDRSHGPIESWLRVDGGERLDVDQGPIGYGAALHFASMLVRDSLLVRRLVRDERLGRKETRERLRLPSALEHLVEREIARVGWSK